MNLSKKVKVGMVVGGTVAIVVGVLVGVGVI